MLTSLHIIGSKQMGGADQFYVRLVRALNAVDHQAIAVNRVNTPIAKTLNNSGIEQIHLPLANQWDFLSVWRIRRLVKERHFDIVQTYMGRATRLTHLPSTEPTVHIARLGGYYKIKGYYEHAHAWVGNTRGVCDYLIRSGLPAERVFFIGNFAAEPQTADAVHLAELRRHLQVPESAMVVFALGRFIEKKGFDDLLWAFATLPRSFDDRPLHLIIAGDGPLRERLYALAEQLDLENRVHWAGWQSQLGPFFQLSDLVVCPSRHEPLGNVILEAWSYAKPVITTATQGALELIQDDYNGLLAPCNDPAQLAARLQEALQTSQQELERLGLAGEQCLHKHHGREAIVNQYLELYSTLRQQRGG